MTRAVAILATAAAIAVSAASPAAASEPGPDIPVVCYNDINVASCVNWAFDTVNRAITGYEPPPGSAVTQWAANTAACAALEITTERDCPYWPATPPPTS